MRRITNISLITVLSLATAYFITRPTGGVGFRAPKQVVKPVSPAPPAPDPTIPAAPPSVVSFLANASGYELANGPYSVSDIEDLVLHDAHRNKDLHVRIFYPNDSGKYPVIVFSHGAGGSQNCCEALSPSSRPTMTPPYSVATPEKKISALCKRSAMRSRSPRSGQVARETSLTFSMRCPRSISALPALPEKLIRITLASAATPWVHTPPKRSPAQLLISPVIPARILPILA